MNKFFLEPKNVPASLRGDYNGKKFSVVVAETVTIPADAGLWSGGSRDLYSFATFDHSGLLPGQNAAPWDKERKDYTVKLEPSFVVCRHTYFCGKDLGLTFYVHPEAVTKLLPAPVDEGLTEYEKIVIKGTRIFKSHYAGMDRYEMTRRDCAYSGEHNFPSRKAWDAAKAELIKKGYLNARGAITVKGKNVNI